MPVKIKEKKSFLIEQLSIECLGINIKDKEVSMDELGIIFREFDNFCKTIADLVGAIRLPSYTSPQLHSQPSKAAARLLEYAQTVEDFTIKGASEALDIPENTLYTIANRYVDDMTMTRTKVLGGMAHIYSLVKKKAQKEKEKPPAIAVLPNSKVPFPERRIDPERERMLSH